MLDYSLIMMIIVGAVAGFIAERVMNFDTGLFMNIVIGILGALVGNWLFHLLGVNDVEGILYQLFVAVFGACVLILVYRSFRGRSGSHP